MWLVWVNITRKVLILLTDGEAGLRSWDRGTVCSRP